MFKAGQYVQVVKDLEGETPDGTMLPGHGSWIGCVGKFVAYRDGAAIVEFEESQIPQDADAQGNQGWFAEAELQKYPMPRNYLSEYILNISTPHRKHHMMFKVTHNPMIEDGLETRDCKVLYMHCNVENQDPFMILKFPDGKVHQVKSYDCYPQVPGWLAHLNWLVDWYGWEMGVSNRWQDLRASVCLVWCLLLHYYPTGNDPY